MSFQEKKSKIRSQNQSERKRMKCFNFWNEDILVKENDKINIVESFFVGNEHYTDEYNKKQLELVENLRNQALLKEKERIESLLNKKTHRSYDPNMINSEIDKEEELIEEDNNNSFGPKPVKITLDPREERKLYSGNKFQQTEAQLYAKYVQEKKRIPRRGEVGKTEEEIKHYEDLGFVMSGNRHKKMTEVRLKKEAQVYSAEEKRALTIFNIGQREKKEMNTINGLRTMWKSKKEENNNLNK